MKRAVRRIIGILEEGALAPIAGLRDVMRQAGTTKRASVVMTRGKN
jgi:hypothetical protein